MKGKERIVVYLSPVTLGRIDLLRGWAGARSRGEAIDIAIDLVLGKLEDQILSWATAQFQQKERKE